MEIKCKKCGSTKVFTDTKGSQTGIYCSDCGKWIKWATKDEIRLIEHNLTSDAKLTVDTIAELQNEIATQREVICNLNTMNDELLEKIAKAKTNIEIMLEQEKQADGTYTDVGQGIAIALGLLKNEIGE